MFVFNLEFFLLLMKVILCIFLIYLLILLLCLLKELFLDRHLIPIDWFEVFEIYFVSLSQFLHLFWIGLRSYQLLFLSLGQYFLNKVLHLFLLPLLKTDAVNRLVHIEFIFHLFTFQVKNFNITIKARNSQHVVL